MALEYALPIKSHKDPGALLALITNSLRPEEKAPGREQPVLGNTYVTRYYNVDVNPVSDSYREYLQEELDIQVDQRVFFRLDKFSDLEAARLSLLRVTSLVLAVVGGDAALLFNGELVLLLRRRGKLALNRDTDFWTPERLSALRLKYEMAPLAMI
jgi:hypothetical protein